MAKAPHERLAADTEALEDGADHPPDSRGHAEGSMLASATAPGKAILLGEHAVVYGHPALALPLPVVSRAVITRRAGPTVVHAPDLDLEAHLDDLPRREPIVLALRRGAAFAGQSVPPGWHVVVTSDLPMGRGLGSSASVAVAVVRACLAALGVAPRDDEVAHLAAGAEAAAHGRSSGIDPTVVALGRPVRYVDGRATELDVGAPCSFVLADSGQAGNTAVQVAKVRRLRDASPPDVGAWLDRIGALVERATALLAEGDTAGLGRVMSDNHRLLQRLGVSTRDLDRLVATALDAGAHGAKLSGAGGGGVAMALSPDGETAAVAHALEEAGAPWVTVARLGATGNGACGAPLSSRSPTTVAGSGQEADP